MKVSVVIPVYNEERTVAELIDKVKNVNLDKEIIVVNDGSTDRTSEIISKINGIKYFNLQQNRGKGYALREGFKQVTGDVVIVQDADLELNPEEYTELIKPIVNNETKIVYGSRFLTNPYTNFISMMANKAVTITANVLYNAELTDEATCYKIFTKDVLKDIDLKCTRFEFCPEFTAKVLKKGYSIKELPISFKPRFKEDGKKVRWRDGFEALWTLLKYRFVD
ncbi:MAG: glycosyltransferase family 2 protein [Candidatus Woesearchaeota archaeon]